MTALVKDGFAVRIPQLVSRYRCNCNKEWGCFVHGDTSKMNSREAEKAGLTKGDFVEMALVCLNKKILTFEPHYINEEFTEIWGIPVKGKMKEQFPENASELSTFLIHRQSKDKLSSLVEKFSKDAFNEWVNQGMKGNYQEYAISKATEYYFSNIFRFEMTQTEGKHGIYYYVKSSFRQAENDIEKKACDLAKEIYEAHLNGLGYCTDSRLELNQQKCQLTLSGNQEKSAQLNSNGKKKILASSQK